MQLSLENVYEVIEVAEMFFLPDLKRQCGVFLAKFIEIDSAVDLICTARLFNIPKLEHSCVEFMAKYIEEVSIHIFSTLQGILNVKYYLKIGRKFKFIMLQACQNWG